MSLRSLSLTPPLVSLFFSAFVVASGVNVTANCTLSSFFWTFNSISQSPCTVAAYMLATCYSGSYDLSPLPPGDGYPGPYAAYANKCECSTVGYSLISACVACQGRTPFYWSAYVDNCTSTTLLPPSQFPNPVPDGIHVPHWAILDVTNENDWDSDKAHQAGDGPEYGPGAIFGPSGVYTSGVTTSSASASSTPSSTPSRSEGHKHNWKYYVPIIAGSVTGGCIAIIIGRAVFLNIRKKRLQAASDPAKQRILEDGAVAHGESQTMRWNDPNDQTTFLGHQGGLGSLVHPSTVSLSSPHVGSVTELHSVSHLGSGGTAADMQSPPRTRGYHGLPCL